MCNKQGGAIDERVVGVKQEYTHSEKEAPFPTLKGERSMLKDYSKKDRGDDNLSVKDAKTENSQGKHAKLSKPR